MTRKEQRQRVWLKYNKHCAYCGKELEYKDMQIDHMYPKAYGGNSEMINLMPSCRRCNHYKRALTLKSFRRLMMTLHERIENNYISRVAKDYGIITIRPFSGRFYFETIMVIDLEKTDILKLIALPKDRKYADKL